MELRLQDSYDERNASRQFGLPVYNGQNFVAEAIQCVLNQTLCNWELVVCDNCSTDSTVAICRQFADQDSRIRVYENARNMGVSFNYNEVLRMSARQYFKWIAHDDLFSPRSSKIASRNLKG